MIEDAGALPAPQARSDTKATLHTVYHTSRSAGYAEVSLLYLDMQTYMLTPTTCACSAIYSRQFCTRVCSLRPRGTKIPVPARILTCAHAGVPNSGQRMKGAWGLQPLCLLPVPPWQGLRGAPAVVRALPATVLELVHPFPHQHLLSTHSASALG